MKIQHIFQVILIGLIATIRSVEAQSVTNTVETQYIQDYGSPKGTNTVNVKFRIHLDPKSGLSTIAVLSHESPILTELAKENVERQTMPQPGKSNLMVDENGKAWDEGKDLIYTYTFRFGRPLQQIEGDALGQLMKGGKLSEDQLKALIQPQAINHLSASNNIPNVNSKVVVEPCLEQLKAIEIAKYQWGFFNSKRPDAVPTWDDIRPFFPRSFPKTSWTNGILVCPDGGTYTLGRLGVPPTCSIGGPGHSLPQ